MIKPLGERIILKPIEEESKTKSGIVLTDESKPKQECFAEVISLGEEAFNKWICEGDKVIYPKQACMPVEIDGEKYIIANVNDILAVLN